MPTFDGVILDQGGQAYDPRSSIFGAVGNGIADDTTALQSCLTAAAGAVVLVPPGTYKVSASLAVSSGTTIIAYGASFVQATAATPILIGANVNNVTVLGGVWQGNSPSTVPTSGPEAGVIWFHGTGTDIRITDAEVFDGYNGISAEFCTRLWVERNFVHDYTLYGILASASYAFHIRANRVYGCLQAGAANAYGIMATGNAEANIQWATEECDISGNHIHTVPSWDGIMSHEVTDLTISHNVIRNVRTGIDIGQFEISNTINRLVCTGNVIEATTEDTWGGTPALHGGIVLEGYDETHPIAAVTITGNIVSGFFNLPSGTALAGDPASISLTWVDRCAITGNVVELSGSSPNHSIGILIAGLCADITVSGNALQGDFSSGGVRLTNVSCNLMAITGNTVNVTNPANPWLYIVSTSVTTFKESANSSNALRVLSSATLGGLQDVETEADLISGVQVGCVSKKIVTLTAACTVGAPANALVGQRIVFTFIQGGAGGFALTWNAVFKKSWSDSGNAAGARSSVAFIYDGTNWNQDGAQAPYV